MAVKAVPNREGVKSEYLSSGEEFFASLEDKGKEREKEERRKARKAGKAAANHSAKPANNKGRRKAGKEKAEQEHGKAVAQASEDLKLNIDLLLAGGTNGNMNTPLNMRATPFNSNQ